MVRYAGPPRPADAVRQRWPEAVVSVIESADSAALDRVGRVQAWAVGSGLGTDADAAALVQAALSHEVPVVLDADAITIVADRPEWLRGRSHPTILTPHAGEFARLTRVGRPDVEARRLESARRCATDLGVTVVLKGSTTVIAGPDGQVRVNSADTPYLATAGSGDVLAGLCGALLAGGLNALDAGSAGAFLHGMSGLLAAGDPPATVTAADLVAHVPAAMRAVRG
jgi:hydroxyethylthiazole kinase-like uncharacterized protein yjeF